MNKGRLAGIRTILALIRLCLLGGILCLLGAVALLVWQNMALSSSTGGQPFPAVTAPGRQLPFLGINVALEATPTDARQASLRRLRQAGFGWVRQRIDWGQLERAPGEIAWEANDALLQDIQTAGLTPVIVLDGSPAWARAPQDTGAQDQPLAPPADSATFARFVGAFASRYHTQLQFYQIWDEPNLTPHWGNRLIEPVAYARLLRSAAQAIRQADPDAVIILGALAPTSDRGHLAIDESYFLQRLYAAGAAPDFDVVAVQPFGFGYRPDDSHVASAVLNFRRAQLIRQVTVAAGDGTTPIWAVRYGWNTRLASPWRTVSPADQITFATEALILAHREWPWLTAMAWAIDQPAQSHADPIWGFALTPPLATALQSWQSTPEPIPTPPSHFPFASSLCWIGALMSLGLLLWRSYASVQLLPWQRWYTGYLAWPRRWQVSIWVLLLGIYFIATWPPLIFFCLLLATLLLVATPWWGLGLAALLTPFYFQHKEIALMGGVMTIPPAYAALGCLAGALLLRLFFSNSATRTGKGDRHLPSAGHLPYAKQHWNRLSTFDWLMLVWLGINLLSMVNVWYWPAYWQGLWELAVIPLLGYGAMRYWVRTPTQQQSLLLVLFAGGVVVALSGLLAWTWGIGTEVDGVLRLVGPYFSPNHTALYLERTFWLGIGLAAGLEGRWRYGLWVLCGVVGSALLLTASRGALLLALPAGMLVFGWCYGQRRQIGTARGFRRHRWLIGGCIVLLGSLLWLLAPAVGERLTNSTTVTQRLLIWQSTLTLWRDYWWFGVGPEGFFWRYPAYLAPAALSEPNLHHPHNVWLELGASWGVIGLLWLLAILWQVGRQSVKVVRRTPLVDSQAGLWQFVGVVAALAAAFAHGQVDTVTVLPDLALWNWLALGLIASITRQDKIAK
ncbi:MAG: O-antigen ligase family protein [Caldilineaceae bacterium]